MARPRYHGYLAKKKSPFLPFIPAEASRFLNSPAGTVAPPKGSKTCSGRNDGAQTPPQSSSDRRKCLRKTPNSPSTCLEEAETVRAYLDGTQHGSQISHRRLDLCLVQKDLGVDPAHGDPSIPVRGRGHKSSGAATRERPRAGHVHRPHRPVKDALLLVQLFRSTDLPQAEAPKAAI